MNGLRAIIRNYMFTLLALGFGVVQGKQVAYEKVEDAAQADAAPQLASGDTVGLKSLGIREQIQNATNLPLPNTFNTILDKIDETALKNVSISRNVLPDTTFEQSYAVAGTAALDVFDELKGELSIRVISAKRNNTWEKSVELSLPKDWQLKDMLPRLAKSPIGSAPLPDGQIIFSTFSYTDEEGFEIGKGVNLAAHVDLKKVAPELHRAIDKLRPKNSGFAQSIVFEGFDSVRLNAHFGRSVEDTRFDVAIPLRIGVDFDELHKKGTLKHKPSGIRRITTGNMVASFEGASQEGSVECGLRIYPTTQKSPLETTAKVQAGPNTVNIMGKMRGSWDPAITNWLALNNPAFELNFDFSLMAELAATGVPVPFTGLKVRGGMGIGPPKSRTTVDLAAGIEVSDDPRDMSFALIGNIDKIDFKQLTHLFARIANKTLPDKKVPQMNLTDVKIYVVPRDMKIADRAYEAGVSFGGGVQIHTFKGGANFVIDSEERMITADGYLEPIKIGKALEITGKGADRKLGTDDDRSRLQFKFPPKKGVEGLLEIDGIVRIPVLQLQNETQIEINENSGKFTISGSLAGTNARVSGNLNVTKLDDTQLRLNIQPNKLDKLVSAVTKKLKGIRQNFRKQLDTGKRKIKEIQNKAIKKIKDEQNRVKRDLQAVQREYNAAKKKCSAVFALAKPFNKDCLNQARLRIKMLWKEKVYHNIILRAGQKMAQAMQVPGKWLDFVKKVEGRLDQVSTAITQASQIKDISGAFRAGDIKGGKLPQVTITLKNGKKYTMQAVTKELSTNIAREILSNVKK